MGEGSKCLLFLIMLFSMVSCVSNFKQATTLEEIRHELAMFRIQQMGR